MYLEGYPARSEAGSVTYVCYVLISNSSAGVKTSCRFCLEAPQWTATVCFRFASLREHQKYCVIRAVPRWRGKRLPSCILHNSAQSGCVTHDEKK